MRERLIRGLLANLEVLISSDPASPFIDSYVSFYEQLAKKLL